MSRHHHKSSASGGSQRQLRVGETVLISGASGGMGQATLQLAKLAGARVIATTRHASRPDAAP